MTPGTWTRTELLAALHLYGQLPFGQLHSRQPRILQMATWLGRTPGSVAMKLVNLASLDPLITASGRSGLKGASKLDRAVWAEQAENWDAVAGEAARAYEALCLAHGLSVARAEGLDGDEDAGVAERDDAPMVADEGRSRQAWVFVRLNQARFRRAVLASYGQRCCITGLSEPRLLVASHIVPWAEDTRNRLNPHNGLCLSALHDRAFDQGLITVTPGSLQVRVSERLRAAVRDGFGLRALVELDGQPIRLPERYRPDDAFLGWHGRRFGFG